MSTAASTPSLIHLRDVDDVAIAGDDLAPGTPAPLGTSTIAARGEIDRGHKIAVRDLHEGDPVRRYGQIIGFASTDIACGEHAHPALDIANEGLSGDGDDSRDRSTECHDDPRKRQWPAQRAGRFSLVTMLGVRPLRRYWPKVQAVMQVTPRP